VLKLVILDDWNLIMATENAEIIYDYQNHLKEARGLTEKTMDAVLLHIHQFERSIGDISFQRVSIDHIREFKADIGEKPSAHTGRLLSASKQVHCLNDLKAFFRWIKSQPGYGKMPKDLADYFTPSKRTTKIAQHVKDKVVASPEDIREVLDSMPTDTIWQRRDHAVIAFLFLTGVRDGAAISLRLKHVDVENRLVNQDANEVDTKFSKTMVTPWFPVGLDIEYIVIDWIAEFRNFGAEDGDPLFPSTPSRIRRRGEPYQLEPWATAAPICKIVKSATQAAGLPYFKPHSIRSTLARMFLQMGVNLLEQKALSQSLGHEHIETTAIHYGKLDNVKLNEVMKQIRERLYNPSEGILLDRIRNTSVEKRALIDSILDLPTG
jgi:site-specific recombinase XerD